MHMQNYRVNGGVISLGPGAVVGLSDQQAARRLPRMERIGGGLFRLREALDFKNGETIKVDLKDIPKRFRAVAVCIDTPPATPAELPVRIRKAAKVVA
jgi:hypothetical protein